MEKFVNKRVLDMPLSRIAGLAALEPGESLILVPRWDLVAEASLLFLGLLKTYPPVVSWGGTVQGARISKTHDSEWFKWQVATRFVPDAVVCRVIPE